MATKLLTTWLPSACDVGMESSIARVHVFQMIKKLPKNMVKDGDLVKHFMLNLFWLKYFHLLELTMDCKKNIS